MEARTKKLYIHTDAGPDPEAHEHDAGAQIGTALLLERDAVVLIEDGDEPLDLELTFLKAAVGDRAHLHVSHRHRLAAIVHFNGRAEQRSFTVATRVGKVRRWAVEAFGLIGVDATEHTLALSGTDIVPPGDAHLGSLPHTNDEIEFDLVPKHRFEG
jgi:hypothetical protein